MINQISPHGGTLDAEFENIYKWYNKNPLTNVTSVTTTGSLTVLHAGLCEGDTSGGAITSTLPAAAGNTGLTFTFILVTAGNDWTISDGATVATLSSADDCVVVRSDGSDWIIISQKLSAGTFTTITANIAGSSLVCEAWHEVGGVGEPAFENSWVNYDAATYQTAAFMKDPFGFVHLKGLVKSGTFDTAIFSLPVGYRPPLFLYVPEAGSDYPANSMMVDVNHLNGAVRARCKTNAYFSLDGITFKT